MKIVADDKIPFLQGILEPYAGMVYLPGKEISREHLMEADALITRTRTQVNRELLEGTPVKFIATATIGIDHLDTEFLNKKGIAWTNAPGCNAGSVMQYMGAALSWLAVHQPIRFQETTLGIIGVGHVGSKVALLAHTLGFNVLLNDPPRRQKEGSKIFIPLNRLLDVSDIVTLHVPLNKTGKNKTLGMVDEIFLSRMKSGASLINCSRGQVVRETLLKEALINRHLSGTILDVWNHEPEIDRELMQMADLATPHIAGYSVDGKANGTAMSVQAISRFFNLPLTNWFPEHLPAPVNPEMIIDNHHLTSQEALTQAILHTYPIEQDSKSLKDGPEMFEHLRGHYRVRREFDNYTITLTKKDKSLENKFKTLGFNIKN